MAPPKLYRDPHEQLVELLRESRREGLRFEDAWQRAVRPGRPLVMSTTKHPPAGAVLWPTDTTERLGWKAALLAARDAYRRAYECRPMTHRENAVIALMRAIDRAAPIPVRGISSVPAVSSAA